MISSFLEWLKIASIKISQLEYWPFYIVYIPIFFYWFWLSIKARSFFYFSAANPSIAVGGMKGESKSKILSLIPSEYLPKYTLVSNELPLAEINSKIINSKIVYPFIIKPDIGERGTNVEKISDEKALINYLKSNSGKLIIQEFIDMPIELGIFYYRYPDQERGVVSSVTLKEFLTVTGDGKSTISDLMKRSPRASMQVERLKQNMNLDLMHIPLAGESVQLEPIGNHCRGTKFINGNNLISEQLVDVFDRISKNVSGFYYGRYDLKCTCISDLMEGKGIKILELNGSASEPAHIYHPGFSISSAYKVLFHHWKVMYEISILNHKMGVPYPGLLEGMKMILRK